MHIQPFVAGPEGCCFRGWIQPPRSLLSYILLQAKKDVPLIFNKVEISSSVKIFFFFYRANKQAENTSHLSRKMLYKITFVEKLKDLSMTI